MQFTTLKVRLYGLEALLGSCPMDKEIYSNYIATKVKSEATCKAAAEDVVNIVENDEKGVTGFYRDETSGNLIIKAYQIKGFLKEAAKAMKDQLGIASTTSKIDNYVFLRERSIPICREDGTPISKPDGYLERPLRGETAQGPRVSLAKSEYVNKGWTLEFTIKVLDNKKTAKSIAMSVDVVKDLLDYGELKGMLQWRNAGYGSFSYEILSEK